MILEQLMEKKDMLAFITFRIQVLQKVQKQEIIGIPTKQIEGAKKQLRGRIKELKYIKVALEQGEVKQLSKKYWNEIAKNYTLNEDDDEKDLYNEEA